MISNCGIGENNSINGVKGDQTGSEYCIQSWHDGGWNYVLRHPNEKIRAAIKQNAVAAAKNNNIGYGQADRETFWDELTKVGYDASKIANPCNADCSSSSCAVCKAAGYLVGDAAVQGLPLTTCRYMPSEFTQAGFVSLTESKYLRSKDYLMPGDVLVNTSKHACIFVGEGNYGQDWTPGLIGSSGGAYWAMFGTDSYTREDGIVREFCYLDDKFQKTSKSTKIKLSVINYTSLFSDIASAKGLVGMSPGGYIYDVNTEGLEGNCKIIVEYLISKGLPASAACGIAANIYYESRFRTDVVGDHGTSFGICQWHNDRGTSMKNFVGANWKNNLSGQLDYLWYDLNDKTKWYKDVLPYIQAVPNTEAGAIDASKYFTIHFESPNNKYAVADDRAPLAAEYFRKLVVNIVDGTGVPGGTIWNGGPLKSKSGAVLSLQKTVNIPSNVAQTGVTGNYTNYSYWFPKWGWTQRKIADAWAAQGKPSNRGIATVDGHYLLAMTTTFGTTGDLLVIHLANGENFSAVLGDSKGAGDGVVTTKWGHYLGSGGTVDVIEWEAIGSTTSNITGRDVELGSWKGVKVASVDNYGSWING